MGIEQSGKDLLMSDSVHWISWEDFSGLEIVFSIASGSLKNNGEEIDLDYQ